MRTVDEPTPNIYNDRWDAAKEQAGKLKGRDVVFRRLLLSLENGWAHIRPVQRLVNVHRRERRPHTDPVVAFLTVFELEATERFREFAFDCAASVPGTPRLGEPIPWDDVLAEAEVFGSFVRVFRMAASSHDLPADVRDTVLEATQFLLPWSGEFLKLLKAADRRLYPSAHGSNEG